jgi:pimeloyl-ACP methyl ester carboxylesterase
VGLVEGWLAGPGGRLHYLASAPGSPSGRPLLVVPGLSDTAEDYRDLLLAVTPRPAVAVSLRGRGGSDTPAAGYRLADHVADVEAAVDQLGLAPCHLFAYSRGVSYALGFVRAHPDAVRSLVVVDYPARHNALPPSWVDWLLATTWRGQPVTARLRPEAVRGIQRDSADVDLWDAVAAVAGPVLVLAGGRRGSAIDAGVLAAYRRHAARLTVAVYPELGHSFSFGPGDPWTAAVVEALAD